MTKKRCLYPIDKKDHGGRRVNKSTKSNTSPESNVKNMILGCVIYLVTDVPGPLETGENIITWKKTIFRRNLNSIYRIIKTLIGQG